jgi:hypothetical protein
MKYYLITTTEKRRYRRCDNSPAHLEDVTTTHATDKSPAEVLEWYYSEEKLMDKEANPMGYEIMHVLIHWSQEITKEQHDRLRELI